MSFNNIPAGKNPPEDIFVQIEIPANIHISPSVETGQEASAYQEKVAGFLAGMTDLLL